MIKNFFSTSKYLDYYTPLIHFVHVLVIGLTGHFINKSVIKTLITISYKAEPGTVDYCFTEQIDSNYATINYTNYT